MYFEMLQSHGNNELNMIGEKGRKSNVNGRSPKSRPRFDWMDGVRNTLCKRDLNVEDTNMCFSSSNE